MKLSDFIASMRGDYRVKLLSDKTMMSRCCFWEKYHDGPEWEKQIDSVTTMTICGMTVFTICMRAA